MLAHITGSRGGLSWEAAVLYAWSAVQTAPVRFLTPSPILVRNAYPATYLLLDERLG